MATQEEILKFVVEAQGADALVPFLKNVKELEGASESTRQAADELLKQLAETTKLRALASAYDAASASIERLGQRSAAADQKVKDLAAEIAASANPTREQQAALERAQAAAARLTTSLQQQQTTLAVYAGQMKAAGLSVGNAAAVQVELATRAGAATKGLADLAAAAAQPVPQMNALTKAINAALGKLAEISAGARNARISMTELNQGIEIAQKTFSALRGVASFFVDQARQAGTLEDALAQLRAVTGATGDEFERLEAAAVAASERTRTGSVEAAQGLTELARAGFDAKESIAALNPVLDLAQGQQLAVARATEFVTTTLTQFQLQADQSARVADVLAGTADASSTSVDQLGNALSYVAPLASQAGKNLEQTAAIIGALADQGFRGERAGTALRNVFSALADPSSKFSQALDEAGIQSRDFTVVIEQLAAKGDGAKRALLALDAEARPAILALVNAGGAGIRDLETRLDGVSGSAARASELLGATFLGAIDRARNALANARNTFLEPLLPVLQAELDTFAKSVNDFAKTDDFKAIAENFAASVERFIQDGKRLATELDFKGLTKDLRDFSESAVANIDSTSKAFGELTALPLALSDALTGGAAVIAESFAGVANDIAEVSYQLTGAGDNAAIFFDDLAQGARRVSDRELAQLQERLGLLRVDVEEAKAATQGAADAARQAAINYQQLAVAMLPEPARVVAQAMLEARDAAGSFAGALQQAQDAASATSAATSEGAGSVADLEQAFADAVKELEKARAAYNGAFSKGTEEAGKAWEAVKRAGTAVADLRKQLDAAKVAAVDVGAAFDELGIKSQKSLLAAAQRGRDAFDEITAAAKRGEAAQQDVVRAFEVYAQRLVATADQADEATRRQIANQIELAGRIAGVRQEMIDTATASLRASETIASAGDQAAQSWTKVREEAKGTGEAFQAAASTVEASAERIVQASDRTSAAMQAQKGFVVELSDEWRNWAEAIGVNVEAWDRLAQNAEIATDRLLQTSKLRRDDLAKTKQATEELAQAEERLNSAQAGGLNTGGGAGGGSNGGGGSGGAASRYELVVKNEQTNPNATPVRLSLEQMDQIARGVFAMIERDRRST